MEVLASLGGLALGLVLFSLGRYVGAEEERQLHRNRTPREIGTNPSEYTQAVRLIGTRRAQRNTADPEELVEPHILGS
jgi:hypothetical protein